MKAKTTEPSFRITLALFLAGMTAAFPMASTNQVAASVAGVWNGAIEAPGIRLAIVVGLQQEHGGVWSGTIDIPQQGATAIPLADLAVKPPDVSDDRKH